MSSVPIVHNPSDPILLLHSPVYSEQSDFESAHPYPVVTHPLKNLSHNSFVFNVVDASLHFGFLHTYGVTVVSQTQI